MMVAIITIAAFQGYWLYKLYYEEYSNIQKQADVLLKQTVQQLQESTLKTDSNFLQYVAQHNNSKKFEVKYDTIHKKLDTTSKPRIKIQRTEPLKDSTNELNYVSVQSSKNKAYELVDSILKNVNPQNIRRINFSSDSNGKKTSTIIIDAKHFNQMDCVTGTALKLDSTKVIFRTKLPKSLKLDSAAFNNQLNRMARIGHFEKSLRFDTNKLNLSNLVIKIFTDSIGSKKVDSVYKQSLVKEKFSLPYKLVVKRISIDNTNIIDTAKKSLHTSPATIGFVNPMAYQAQFDNPFWFIVKRLSVPISISILLLSFVIIAFIFLYKNMMSQHRLAVMKSDFISNITHELKTPIATVNVAIEALRNFNAIEDKKKSQDYLNISAIEINRLGLLVDNVLKLSMFENDKIELQKESVDIVALTNEVINALGIQIDKKKANIDVNAEPENIFINADKLHLTSILFNLIDNALKYSKENSQIDIKLKQINNQLHIVVSDNGIGISKENQQKIFDKFYRVETNDRHNVKGYGLGLSYVNYIVKKHNGTVKIKSELNKGSVFEIVLPL